MRLAAASLVLMGLAQSAGGQSAPAGASADTIYTGTVVTMDAERPRAEAVAVHGERIVAVGARSEVMARRGPNTRVVDLGSRALLPGFIDAHGHLTASAAVSAYANLASPPVGRVTSIRELQDALRRHIREHAIPKGQWVIGFGYDESLLAEKRHPNRAELDAVSVDHPVFVIHVSGHFSAGNSRLLSLAKIDAATPDPKGGVIRREPGTATPNGVLEETAHMAVYGLIPRPAMDEALARIDAALAQYARMGITLVQDGGAGAAEIALLSEAARRGRLSLDVVAYRLVLPVGSPFPDDLAPGPYSGRFRVGGVKVILDGAPQGKTAFLSRPYHVPPPGVPADYRGYPATGAEELRRTVVQAMSRGFTLLAHANGDAAQDMLLDAVRAARQETGARSPVVMIHAQTIREDQVDQLNALGVMPSFFVGHTFFWGDWHREQTLGFPRAEKISPLRSALDRGVAFTLHNDSPIVPPDIVRTLWSAATRRTRTGDILGPAQRIPVASALEAVTINAARQYGEEALRGSIRAGKLADLVILSRNPVEMDPESLLDLRVIETISRGKSLFRASVP